MLTHYSRPLFLSVCGLALAACNSTSDFANEGSVCFRSAEEGQLEVRVVFPTCLSSSCDTARRNTCRIEVDGSTLRIESRATVESSGGSCTDDCGLLAANCSSDALEPGEYTLQHGDESVGISVPIEFGRLPDDAGDALGCNF